MRFPLPLLILILLCSQAGSAATGEIEITGGYVRALPPTVSNTAAYLTVSNGSRRDRVLVGGRTPAAERAELHETVAADGQVSMRRLELATVPAGGELVLEPGGRHFMLMGLTAPLSPGNSVEITLIFQDGDEFTTSLPVRSVLSEN